MHPEGSSDNLLYIFHYVCDCWWQCVWHDWCIIYGNQYKKCDCVSLCLYHSQCVLWNIVCISVSYMMSYNLTLCVTHNMTVFVQRGGEGVVEVKEVVVAISGWNRTMYWWVRQPSPFTGIIRLLSGFWNALWYATLRLQLQKKNHCLFAWEQEWIFITLFTENWNNKGISNMQTKFPVRSLFLIDTTRYIDTSSLSTCQE